MKEATKVRSQDPAPVRRWASLAAGACLTAVIANAASGAPVHGIRPNGLAPGLAHAADMGAVSTKGAIEVTVWLALHNEDALNSTIEAQHAGSASYLSASQIDKQYAPAAADAAAVSDYLRAQGLSVTAVGPHNLYVKASGTVAGVQSAFGVQLHEYSLNGETFRASTTRPRLPSTIAPLVAHVGGLSTAMVGRPMIARQVKPSANGNVKRTSDPEGMPARDVPFDASASPNGLYFAAQCIYPPTTVSFSADGVSASYTGAVYGAPISNSTIGQLSPCGYQPSDLQTAYNLKPLYKAGLDGTGTTIAIVDAYGSTTIQQDLAAFSAAMGLPAGNLTVVGTPTASNYSTNTNLAGWAGETTLDVEWVHAIAPGAKILLVVTPTNSFDDLFAGITTALSTPGVVAISNSWSSLESYSDPLTRQFADGIFKVANAKGASVMFASGDYGNETIEVGYADVDYPGSSPYATSVGGVSVTLTPNKQIQWETSWGNNITELADTVALGSPPLDLPYNEGFVYGGGGGISSVYPAPVYQRFIGAVHRQVPDISWVADPYTGVEIIYTASTAGALSIGVIGGTSLATPMFSALWGIVAQKVRHPLGNAASYLYSLPPGAVLDVVPPPPLPTNVTGTLTDAYGTEVFGAGDLALPLQNNTSYASYLYQSPSSTRWFVLSFGLDSTLTTGYGWDPATGVGTPNGWSFVQAFH